MRVTCSASSRVSGGRIAAEPPRQHRLAGARRADEQHVVPARGRDRQRADRRGVPADVAQVLGVGPRAVDGRAPAAAAGGGSPRRIAATPARSLTPATATPSTRPASAAHSRGTMSPSSPWRRAPSATASAPPHGRSSPPRESSPKTAQRSSRSAGTWPLATSRPHAVARS